MPAPLIQFASFAHPQQWFLRRGEPPWLENESRWWVRAFRVSLVLGLLGTASGWLAAVCGSAFRVMDEVIGNSCSELGMFLSPGICFGIGTLLPLSRWLGRGWIFSLLAIPASIFASFCGAAAFLFASPIMSSPPAWVPGGKEAAGFYAGFAGAAVIAVWMGHPRRRAAWLAWFAAVSLASLGTGCLFLFPQLTISNRSFVPSSLGHFMDTGMILVSFQSLTAVGLGVRFWWAKEGVRGENP